MKPISLIFPLTSDWKTGNKCKKNREENIKSMSKHTRYMILVFNLCIFCCPCSVWLKDNNYVWRGLLSLSLQSLSCFITAVYLNLHRGLLLQYALTDNHLNTIFTRYERLSWNNLPKIHKKHSLCVVVFQNYYITYFLWNVPFHNIY